MAGPAATGAAAARVKRIGCPFLMIRLSVWV